MRILDVLGVLWGLSTALVANAAVTANVVRPKGIWKRHDTFITVTNATLYQWKRGHQHAYQVKQWEAWPDSIDAGQSVQVRVKRRGGHKKSDSAAEVQYWLVGTSERMEMQFEYPTHQVRVRYMEELATMGQGRGSEQVLGFETYPGGVVFVLAGSEAGGFVANGAPAGWMQATLRDVGHLPLRQLAMPRTHHTGMWKGVAPLGFASKANTLTQMTDLWTQLTEGGVRVLDVRATWMVHWKWAQWREAHTVPMGFYGIHGMLGAGIEEMVDVINRFNDEFPGELIILDMHSDAMRIENSLEFRRANKEDRADLYRIPERALRGPDAVAASPLRRQGRAGRAGARGLCVGERGRLHLPRRRRGLRQARAAAVQGALVRHVFDHRNGPRPAGAPGQVAPQPRRPAVGAELAYDAHL